jgi:hypothetical protein
MSRRLRGHLFLFISASFFSSAPFARHRKNLCLYGTAWWDWEDSNPQPNDYQSLVLRGRHRWRAPAWHGRSAELAAFSCGFGATEASWCVLELHSRRVTCRLLRTLHFRFARRVQAGNLSPNMGRPLRDASFFTSSWMTSQCSASLPFARRTISATIQFAGRPMPLNRPWSST